jgi:iron complex transport system ATP-binding protein
VSEPVLELSGVTVRRGGRAVLDRVDWKVLADERWVVLGPNGAGKTTLLQVAAAHLAPDEGRVAVLGEPSDELDPEDVWPRIGLSSAAVADRLPAAERVLDVVTGAAYAVLGRGGAEGIEFEADDERRAAEFLAQVGCRALVDREYGTLSEGERKRVQIARALMTNPELLLLDEPSAGLDLTGREALLRRLTRLVADPRGPAVVLVTHHVEEIPVGATHGLLLRAGRVVASGPLPEVMTRRALSACFGLPLLVDARDGRYAARALP